jgi:hypothetical protein
MFSSPSRAVRIGAIFAGLFALAFLSWWQLVDLTPDPPTVNLNKLPKGGYAYNETNGKVLGNPQNGIDDLKELYRLLQVYRERHQGQYPPRILKML